MVMELVSADGISVLTILLATSFRLFSRALLYLCICGYMYFYIGQCGLCHFDNEEAMVASLKTLSPLQTPEVENIQETCSRHHKLF